MNIHIRACICICVRACVRAYVLSRARGVFTAGLTEGFGASRRQQGKQNQKCRQCWSRKCARRLRVRPRQRKPMPRYRSVVYSTELLFLNVYDIVKTQNGVEMLMNRAWVTHHRGPLTLQQSLTGGAGGNVNGKCIIQKVLQT